MILKTQIQIEISSGAKERKNHEFFLTKIIKITTYVDWIWSSGLLLRFDEKIQ